MTIESNIFHSFLINKIPTKFSIKWISFTFTSGFHLKDSFASIVTGLFSIHLREMIEIHVYTLSCQESL